MIRKKLNMLKTGEPPRRGQMVGLMAFIVTIKPKWSFIGVDHMIKKTTKSGSVNQAAAEIIRLMAPNITEAQLPPGFVATSYLIKMANTTADHTRHKMRTLVLDGKVECIQALNKNKKLENYYRPK